MQKNNVSIGLEIHASLKTNRKSFSPEIVDESSWVSLGFPGTLPTINLESIEKTIQLSYSLNCLVNYDNIVFDRKNYFYYDLPKGYQITQYFHPIGKNGFIYLSSNKKIRIRQVHLEEDSAQQIKQGHEINLIFSRLGRAIAEIVTEPDFSSYEEIEEFLYLFRRICTFNSISDASYSEGELRIDLNISLIGSNCKYEVKNLNSLFALKKSIDYFLNNDKLESQSYTYGWIEKLSRCEIMRKKLSREDYFYIPESNIPKISFTKEKFFELTKDLCLDFQTIEQDFLDKGLKTQEVFYLLDNFLIFYYVKRLDSHLDNLTSSYNWIVNIVSGLTNIFESFNYEEVEKTIIDSEKNKKFNMKIAKSILKEILKNKSTYKTAFRQLKISPILNREAIVKLVEESFEKYKDQLPTLILNMPRLERLIIGETMKISKGQADPIETKKIFQELASKHANLFEN